MKTILTYFHKTSTQITILSITAMIFVSLGIGYFLNATISDYIFDKKTQYINTVAEQIQTEINLTLQSIDNTLQQLGRSPSLQRTLYAIDQGESYDTDKFKAIRSEVLFNLSISTQIDSIELYSNQLQLYPHTNLPIYDLIPHDNLATAKKDNGAISWHTSSLNGKIYAVKRLILSDYDYTPGGFVVATITPDFLSSLETTFTQLENSTVIIQDKFKNTVASYPKDFNVSEYEDKKDYRVISSISEYSDWEIRIYIPRAFILNDLTWLRTNIILLFTLGFMLFMILSVFFSRYIYKPIIDLRQSLKLSKAELKANVTLYRNSDINDFNDTYNELIHQNKALYTELLHKDLLKTKAEMKALQSQVDPHFIVNCLESVYFTLLEKGLTELSNTIMSLAKLFRYILSADELVTISKEFELIKLYLNVQEFRFGDKLKWHIEVDTNVNEQLIPKLLIQPLIENVIKHGLETVTHNVFLSVKATINDEGRLIIMIDDTGKGITPTVLADIDSAISDDVNSIRHDSGIGIINVYKRIKLHYGDRGFMKVKSDEQKGGVSIEISLPMDSGDQNDD